MSRTVTPRKVPELLYHFTDPRNVPAILRTGLKPFSDGLGNPPAVWLNCEPVEVMGQTMLEVRTGNLDRRKFLVFKDHPDSPIIYMGAIPASNIQPLFSTLDEPTLLRSRRIVKEVRRHD